LQEVAENWSHKANLEDHVKKRQKFCRRSERGKKGHPMTRSESEGDTSSVMARHVTSKTQQSRSKAQIPPKRGKFLRDGEGYFTKGRRNYDKRESKEHQRLTNNKDSSRDRANSSPSTEKTTEK